MAPSFSQDNNESPANIIVNLLSFDLKFSSEIDLLRSGKLDSDIISEISQKMLGLIQTDQIVIKIPK